MLSVSLDPKHEPMIDCNSGQKREEQFCSLICINSCDHYSSLGNKNRHEFFDHECSLMNVHMCSAPHETAAKLKER